MGIVDEILISLVLIFTYICIGGCGGHSKLSLKVRNYECRVVSLGNVVLRMTFGKPGEGSEVQ